MKYPQPEKPAAEGGRSPCGERGLKSDFPGSVPLEMCRSPCGERGLKLFVKRVKEKKCGVAPRAGSVG